MPLRLSAALLALTLGGAGCATPRAAAPPPRELKRAEAVLLDAEQAVAGGASPQATLHLQLAQDQLRMARERLKRGDAVQAQLLSARAEADAALAEAYARLERAQRAGRP